MLSNVNYRRREEEKGYFFSERAGCAPHLSENKGASAACGGRNSSLSNLADNAICPSPGIGIEHADPRIHSFVGYIVVRKKTILDYECLAWWRGRKPP